MGEKQSDRIVNSSWTSRSLLSLLFALFFLLPTFTNGQDTTGVDKPPAPRIEGGSGQIGSTNGEFVMTKSPTTALLWAIIPSGGQVYTEQYWKVPVFLIPIGALVGLGIYNNGIASDYNDQLQTLTKGSPAYNVTLTNREQFRDNRDLSWTVAGGIYLLSFIDAYVGAHLFDFDVGDSLSSIEIYPDFARNGVGISARW